MDINKVAEAWVEMWSFDVNDPERDRFEWVEDFEYEATHEKPDVGFDLIIKILSLNPSNHVLEVLSAGPLEDLLAYHGETLIDRVETEANSNSAFANLLGGVWQNMMPNHIWERVQKASDKSGWDGNPSA